ncbi:TPA: hypothetical protein ACH3X1_014476 [Trebouxia sp. C0004]
MASTRLSHMSAHLVKRFWSNTSTARHGQDCWCASGRYLGTKEVASTNLSMIVAQQLLKLEPSSASGVAYSKE